MFAEATAGADLVGAVTNLGAVGIIGVFMLRVLPAIAGQLGTSFKEGVVMLGQILKAERDGFDARAAKIEDQLRELRNRPGCKLPDGWTP